MGVPTGIYLRISDDPEGRELGVKRQEEDLRALCKRSGDDVVDVYKDNDISASTRSKKERPDYQRILADARSGRIKKIAAYTTSRLTRQPRENEDLIELAEQVGTTFAYVKSPSFDLNSADGRHMARMIAAADAAEAERTSERVQRAQSDAATDGRHRGGPRPFGFEPDGVTVRPDEAEVIRTCSERLLAGETLHSLCAELEATGVRTSRDKTQWRHTALAQILKRSRNAALVTYRGEVVGPAQWPAIVDEGTWRAVCALLADESRRTSASSTRIHLGSGLYLCGVCNNGTTCRSAASRGSRSRPNAPRAYRCRKSGHLVRQADPIDALVERVVVLRLAEPDAVALLATGPGEDVAKLHHTGNVIRTRLNELAAMYADPDADIDAQQFKTASRDLRKRLVDVEQRIAAASAGSPLAGLAGNPDIERLWFGTRPDRSDGLSVGRRAAVVDTLMLVTLLPARRGRQPGGDYFDPNGVRIEWRR